MPINPAQRQLRIGDDDLRKVAVDRPLDQCGRGAGAPGILEEQVRVVAFAAQGDEQRAVGQVARVGGYRSDMRIGAEQAAAGAARDRGEIEVQHGLASSAACATLRSSKG
jgi:hypothetical protein